MNSNIRRVLYIVVAVAIAMVVVNTIRNPHRARARALAQQLNEIDSNWSSGESRRIDPPAVQADSVLARDDLWQGLVAPPPVAQRPFDMEAALRGVEPTSRTQGVGSNRKARIRTPGDPRGSYYGAGEKLRGIQGITVSQVGDDFVVFSAEYKGKTYEMKVRR